MRRRA
jgi:hypothetical protein